MRFCVFDRTKKPSYSSGRLLCFSKYRNQQLFSNRICLTSFPKKARCSCFRIHCGIKIPPALSYWHCMQEKGRRYLSVWVNTLFFCIWDGKNATLLQPNLLAVLVGREFRLIMIKVDTLFHSNRKSWLPTH